MKKKCANNYDDSLLGSLRNEKVREAFFRTQQAVKTTAIGNHKLNDIDLD